jgi:hypothetical protein
MLAAPDIGGETNVRQRPVIGLREGLANSSRGVDMLVEG